MRTRVRMIRNLVGTTVSVLICGMALGQTTTNGLVGYWPMDNTRGTEITDQSTNSNHGAFDTGSPEWESGKFGNCMYIFGARLDTASIPHHAAFNANGIYSLAFWLKPTSTYRSTLLTKGESAIKLTCGNASVDLDYFGTGWPITPLGFNFGDAWHHIAIVYDPSAVDSNTVKQLYVDGALRSATNAAVGDTALNTSDILFHSRIGFVTKARYDDIAVWDRPLTTTEISYLYNGGTGNIVADLNTPPTAAPTNVTAFASDKLVALSWNTNTVDLDFSTYSVYQAGGSGGPYTRVASNLTATTGVATNLVNGTPYYFVIRTVDLRGAESGNSLEVTATPLTDSTPPAAPTGVSAESGYTRLYLFWAANTEPDLAGYNIYQSSSIGGPFVLTQALVTATATIDEGRTNGVTVYYYVKAEDLIGNESPQSSIVSATPESFQDTNPDMVGYWPMDASAGTNISDMSQYANHGSVASGTNTWVAGKFGNALALNKADIVIASIPHHASYIATDTYSISFWHQPLFGYRASGAFSKGARVSMGVNAAAVRWKFFGSDPWSERALGYAVNDGGWHHLVVTFDPSATNGKRLYCDGILLVSQPIDAGLLDLALNASPINFSAETAQANDSRNRFDDVAIWDVALSLDQVQSLWNEGVGRTAYAPPPAGALIIIR